MGQGSTRRPDDANVRASGPTRTPTVMLRARRSALKCRMRGRFTVPLWVTAAWAETTTPCGLDVATFRRKKARACADLAQPVVPQGICVSVSQCARRQHRRRGTVPGPALARLGHRAQGRAADGRLRLLGARRVRPHRSRGRPAGLAGGGAAARGSGRPLRRTRARYGVTTHTG
jgi:hypothetical protein